MFFLRLLRRPAAPVNRTNPPELRVLERQFADLITLFAAAYSPANPTQKGKGTSALNSKSDRLRFGPPGMCEPSAAFADQVGRTASYPTELTSRDSSIDDRAVFSVLQFGAIVPPLSPWRGVRRLVARSGHDWRADSLRQPERGPATPSRYIDTFEHAAQIERLIDSVLIRQLGDQADPVVLFSGGVDSSFIASRLAAVGYKDAVLVNYSFGDDDPESIVAEAIASDLGLNFQRVNATGRQLACLDEPGVVYPQPFADHSTVPTSDLARAIVDKLTDKPRVILDGTGADGGFGLVKKKSVYGGLYRHGRPHSLEKWHY